MKPRLVPRLALLAALGLAFLSGCGGDTPTVAPSEPPIEPEGETRVLTYFGIAQYRGAVGTDYLRYINDQFTYSNLVAVSFEYDSSDRIIAPTPSYLAAIQGFPKSALLIGQDVWSLSLSRRQNLFQRLRAMVGYENIDVIGIIDEPYLGGFSPAQLQNIITEGKQSFPNKQYAVNYNPREFYAQNRGPNAPLYDGQLHYISFDMYPANFETSCTNQTAWKQKVKEDIDFFQARTGKPLLYTGQGFSRAGCALTPDMIQWTYDVAAAEGVFGLMFWFAEDLQAPFTGFSSTPVAEQKIREVGRRITGK